MREFGIASIVLFLALSSISGPEVRSPQTEERRIDVAADHKVEFQENLRLLTYNAFLRPPPVSWGDKNTCRAQRIGERLKNEAIPRDIIALNESFAREDVTKLGEALEERFPHQLLGLPDAEGFRTNGGLSLLSRYPIEHWEAQPFDECSGDFNDCLATKGLLWGLVRVSDHLKVNVVVTHLNSGGTEHAQQVRRSQLRQISDFIDSERLFDRWPTVLMGDLNVNGLRWKPNTPDGGELTEYAQAMRELGNSCAACETAACFADCNSYPVDTFRQHNGRWSFDAHGTRQANTYNCPGQLLAPCTDLNSAEHWRARLRIDYILHFGPPSLVPDMSVRVLRSASRPFKDNTCGTTYLSDHQGIEATIEIQQSADLNAQLGR